MLCLVQKNFEWAYIPRVWLLYTPYQEPVYALMAMTGTRTGHVRWPYGCSQAPTGPYMHRTDPYMHRTVTVRVIATPSPKHRSEPVETT